MKRILIIVGFWLLILSPLFIAATKSKVNLPAAAPVESCPENKSCQNHHPIQPNQPGENKGSSSTMLHVLKSTAALI